MTRKTRNTTVTLQRPAAEVLYADELKRLAEADGDAPRPGSWKLTPQSVIKFVQGDRTLNITPKFVGSRSQLECSVVALATNRGNLQFQARRAQVLGQDLHAQLLVEMLKYSSKKQPVHHC